MERLILEGDVFIGEHDNSGGGSEAGHDAAADDSAVHGATDEHVHAITARRRKTDPSRGW